MHKKSEFVIVGTITKPFGLRGEVKVRPEPGLVNDLVQYEEFIVFVKGGKKRLKVENVRSGGAFLIFKFEGINSVDDAELVRGLELFVSEDELVELEEDEFYFYQLEGLTVRTTQGEVIGKVSKIMPMPASEIIQVVDEGGRETLIPAIKVFVKKIDLDAGEITVELPRGLVDEERE